LNWSISKLAAAPMIKQKYVKDENERWVLAR
jgi:hypothetical protein